MIDKVLIAAKFEYLYELLLDWKYGRLSSEVLKHIFNNIIDVDFEEFYALLNYYDTEKMDPEEYSCENMNKEDSIC